MPHFRRNVHSGIVVVVVPKVVVVEVVVLVVVELVVVELEEVVVAIVEVVVVVPHAGSAGSVQEQSGFVMQFVRTDFLHALRSLPDKPGHATAISSAQVLLVHFPAALASETKTPAASATAANATTARLVIVEPPLWPFRAKLDFGATTTCHGFDARQGGKSRRDAGAEKSDAPESRRTPGLLLRA
jgi:hypothetical protein